MDLFTPQGHIQLKQALGNLTVIKYNCIHALSGLTDQDVLNYNSYAVIDHCEDCNAPIVWSCCNDEVGIDEDGGYCRMCGEHCL